ncbi:MAG TPA: hypothetical protein PLI99_01675 [archaeon]|nr:hypothetical protein [archaeon]
MKNKLIYLTLLFLILTTTFVQAISTDEAITLTTTQNNYLLNGETASVAKELIQYKGTKYIVVAATKGNTVNCYIPINNSTKEIAKLDLEIRELIKTTIIYTKMNELNQSISTANWPLTHSTKNMFYDLSKEFNTTKSNVLTVKTELERIKSDAQVITKTNNLETKINEIIKKSDELFNKIEEGREYEQNFFNSPDSNKILTYEEYYKNYFSLILNYKTIYNEFETNLNELIQSIATLENEDITIDEKRSLQSFLVTPTSTRKLPNFFGTTDELRTTIESVFNSSKNSENYATTLKSREVRNSAWVEMYARNETLLKIDKSFETLEIAANAILSNENINQWSDEDAVDALTANWNSAKSRFNNAEYEKAKDYALKAQKNVEQIIMEGIKINEDKTNDYIMIIVGVLIVALIGLFAYENIYLKKKKKKQEDYNEPNY